LRIIHSSCPQASGLAPQAAILHNLRKERTCPEGYVRRGESHGTHRRQDGASAGPLDDRTTGKGCRIQSKPTARRLRAPGARSLRLNPVGTQQAQFAKGSRCPISPRTAHGSAFQVFGQMSPQRLLPTTKPEFPTHAT
jgi:hypothetical protein